MVAICSSAIGIRQRCLLSNRQAQRVRPVLVVRVATPNADTSGKTPDSAKPPAQQAAAAPTADSRQTASPSSSAAGASKARKGSWTPPFADLVNTKPLPTEDVKTNIDH